MEDKFDLSKKITSGVTLHDYIEIKDIKEFIRLLKEESKRISTSNDVFETKNKYIYIDVLEILITQLAGKSLTKGGLKK